MPCRRCGGLTVPEQFENLAVDGAWLTFIGRRCVNCGHIEDKLIRANGTDDGRVAGRLDRGRRWS
jgi:hypothetical protein